MRTTVEIPDELFRRAKAEAALRGRHLRDLVEEGLRRVLGLSGENAEERSRAPSFHDAMKDCCGIAEHAPRDLSTNREHLEGFGR